MSNYQWVTIAATAFFTALAVFSFWRAMTNASGSYAEVIGFKVVGTLSVAATIVFALIFASRL